MIESQVTLAYHVEKFYNKQTLPRKASISRRVREVATILNKILNEVQQQEPRFVSPLDEEKPRFEGLEVISPNEYQVVLFLNQMGVYSFMDSNEPGCATLKLKDGKKRGMSLWVEFITASGYLSARKVRSRFQSLVSQVVEKLNCKDTVRLDTNTTDVRLIIQESTVVRIVPAFRCEGLWPHSAVRWPSIDVNSTWPAPSTVAEAKAAGVNLLSKQILNPSDKQNSTENDAWVISFTKAEDKLIGNGTRKKCLSILKTLRDRHLNFHGLNNYHMKTLLLYECDKHQLEVEWSEAAIGDRIQGILIQLISCLRCRKLPHYFIPDVDLFVKTSPAMLEDTIRQVWCLAREIITNSKNFDNL